MEHTVTHNTRRAWRYLLWLPALLMLLLFLLGLIADAWLESRGGRQLLQRELSQRLGFPVALQGDYGLKFLPRLKIAGSGLEVGQRGEEGVSIYSRNFSAEVEIVPLIRRELRIVAIGLSDGFINLAKLSGPGKGTGLGAGSPDGTSISLPDLASLNLNNFSIRYGEASDRMELGELQLTGFKAGVPSDLAIRVGMFRGETAWAAATMRGRLTVEAADLSTELDISELQIALGKTVIDGLTGSWRWERSAARLEGWVDWVDAVRAVSLQFELALGGPVSGALRGSYRDPVFAWPMAFGVFFKLLPDVIDLQQVKIDLGEQHIDGSGCLRFADKSGLHLSLLADELDLDELNPILSIRQGGAGDLPMGLAIRMRVEKARMAGAVADGVSVEIGAEPDCAAAGNIVP